MFTLRSDSFLATVFVKLHELMSILYQDRFEHVEEMLTWFGILTRRLHVYVFTTS
jgi:hypothetical protein